ncbi:MAG: peptidoglycan DD-metalloendopeptidase family protein [Cyclobacteriaceae bacterium]
MIIYLVKVSLVLTACFSLYWLLFRKSTLVGFSRGILLLMLALSLSAPLWDYTPQNDQLQQVMVELEPATHYLQMVQANKVTDKQAQTDSTLNWYNTILGIYWLVVFLLIIRYIHSLRTLFNAYRKHLKTYKGIKVYSTSYPKSHSFFQWIFLAKTHQDQPGELSVLEHEYHHVRLGHSYDRLLMDLFVILFWFNPFIYLYRKGLIEVHEFQADQETINKHDRITYQQLLLAEVKRDYEHSLVSYFNVSLTKKRIMMMNKHKTSKLTLLKSLFVIPIVLGFAVLFSFKEVPVMLEEHLVTFPMPNDKATIVLPEFQEIEDPDDVPSILPVDMGGESIRLSSGFGKRKNPNNSSKFQWHQGIDIPAKTGAPVVATADGAVTVKNHKGGFGKHIYIEHGNGYKTQYAHLSAFNVKSGQNVKKGDLIGFIGSTGLSTSPHLHYEVIKSDKHVDPMEYINDYKLSEKYFQKIVE